jgi:ribosomal protein S8
MFFDSCVANTISAINVGYRTRQSFIRVPTTKFMLSILDRLVEFQCIKSYVLVRNDYKKIVMIYLNYIDGLPAISCLKLIGKNSKSYTTTVKALRLSYFYHSGMLCFLTTSCGILTVQEALTLGCGGFLLLSVHY